MAPHYISRLALAVVCRSARLNLCVRPFVISRTNLQHPNHFDVFYRRTA